MPLSGDQAKGIGPDEWEEPPFRNSVQTDGDKSPPQQMARFNKQIAIAVDRMDNVLKEDGLAQKSSRWLRLLNQRCDRSLISC
jgi:hypothetical protein